MHFSLAIDDDLAEELCKFKENQKCDIDIIEKALHYHKGYPSFTRNYFKRYYTDINIQRNILQSYSHIEWDSLESIRKNTAYKIILSSKRNVKLPYVSIYDDKIENNFTATFFKNEPRQNALEYFRLLLENANCIFIYDIYLFQNNVWSAFIDFAIHCFPNKPFNIFYPQSVAIRQNVKLFYKQIKQNNSYWNFKPDKNHHNFINLHDRYLVIDNRVEVILTSGIEYLMNTNKDFTYIIRLYRQSLAL